MIALDTETTGVDHYHGALPFFVTTCNEDKEITYWEWYVDPMTRIPEVPPEDISDIVSLIGDADQLVLHNAKFDAAAVRTIVGHVLCEEFDWPWEKTVDTLMAAHLLHSNRPKDLTSMAFQWLNKNIEPFEDRLEDCVKEARRLVGSRAFTEEHGEWAIAKAGRTDMPSAKETVWKYDSWLPRAIARHLRYPQPDPECKHQYLPRTDKEMFPSTRLCAHCKGHQYWTVTSDYANVDSQVTVALWGVLDREIDRRGLRKIFKLTSRRSDLAYRMESNGVTCSGANLNELRDQYREDSDTAKAVCTGIAAQRGFELELPKAGANKSLRAFMFDVLELEQIRGVKSKTDAPTLDKTAMTHYVATLPPGSDQLEFVKTLLMKRAKDTAIQYMDGYERFWLPLVYDQETGDIYNEWFRLHPSLNPTGTDTLRWSSSNPNEQNISKKEIECEKCEGEGCAACHNTGKSLRSLRYAFCPAPGREWWSNDGKNLELRLPAYEAGETDMINLFEQPDTPPYYGSNHLLNFHTVYPDIWEKELREVGLEKVGPHCKKKYASDWYQYCKNGGFAIQYNCGRNTADRAFHRHGCFDLLKSRFAKMEALNQKCIRFSEKTGYVETIPDKTVDPLRGYPLLVTRTERGEVLSTVPLSYHIQGSAMWWMLKAMIRCQEQMDEWNRQAGIRDHYRFALQIHDELVFDFPKKEHPKKSPARSNLGRIRILQRLMAQGGDDFGIPTPVSCEHHEHNWSEGVTL